MLRNLNQSSAGKRICGIPRVGMLASAIPTGFPLPALLLNDIDSGFPNRLYSVEILTWPSAGLLYVYEDSSLSFTGAPDGTYTGGERVRKYDPGVGIVSAEDTTYSLTIGTPSADTAGPVMVGPITATATQTTIAATWPAATDPSGIGEYRIGVNGGTPISTGMTRAASYSSLTASTPYALSVFAYDTLGNVTGAPLTLNVTTLAAGVTLDPTPDPVPAPTLPDATLPVTAASRSYAWLKQAVAKWTHRGDLGPMMDDFIMLAEKRIDGDLEARLQDVVTTIATVARLNAVLVPHDVAEIRSLNIMAHGALDYLAADQFSDQYAVAGAGVPHHYTVIGPYLYLGPTPDAVYSMHCAYRQQIPSLLDEADGVNWLIRDHAEIYLAAVMCEVLGYTQNESQAPRWEAKYKIAVDSLNKVDWHTGGALRVRSDVQH